MWFPIEENSAHTTLVLGIFFDLDYPQLLKTDGEVKKNWKSLEGILWPTTTLMVDRIQRVIGMFRNFLELLFEAPSRSYAHPFEVDPNSLVILYHNSSQS